MKLEFTTTACLRPELLEKTYESLSNVIIDVDLLKEGVLYINIDPVPNVSESLIQKVIKVARSYFNKVYHRIGQTGGNFSCASSWVLSQPKGDYFFNVEDDWLFRNGTICIQDYINEIKNNPKKNILQCVVGKSKKDRSIRQNRVHFPPSLFQTKIIQSYLKKYPIPNDTNPEKWIEEIKTVKKLVDYNITYLGGVKCSDIGYSWRKARGIEKKSEDGFEVNFTQWDL